MRRFGSIVGGGAIILLGLLLLATEFLDVGDNIAPWMGAGGMLLMGLALLAYYADSRAVAALIPGCVLAGLGIGILLTTIIQQAEILWILGALGASFFAIDIIDRRAAGRSQTWARLPGAILVGLGLMLFGAEYVPERYEALTIIAGIGVILTVIALAMRAYGLLIPGGLMIGIGLGVFTVENLPVEDLAGAGVILGGIGLGFVLVYLLDRLFLRASNAWPMIPAVILIGGGAVFYFAARAGVGAEAQEVLNIVWAALLIAFGLWIIARQMMPRKRA